MSRYLLDTETITLAQFGHAVVVRNLIVVTRNVRDFNRVPGVQTEDWSV